MLFNVYHSSPSRTRNINHHDWWDVLNSRAGWHVGIWDSIDSISNSKPLYYGCNFTFTAIKGVQILAWPRALRKVLKQSQNTRKLWQRWPWCEVTCCIALIIMFVSMGSKYLRFYLKGIPKLCKTRYNWHWFLYLVFAVFIRHCLPSA